MANARKCDRCGLYYDEYNVKDNAEKINGINILNINSNNKYFLHGPYDLCPACSDYLMKWLRKENIDDYTGNYTINYTVEAFESGKKF